ncbi:MAG: hypothetical protein P1U39_04140 [Legionellaceae bacterium]|nr:hypothetical protein [Legionellaceae bacterium]
MSFFFRNPTNLELASRLKQNALQYRENTWTDSIYWLSRFYQLPKDKFEHAVHQDGAERYDRKFLLIQAKLEDITPADLNRNYGYILAPDSNEPWFIVPSLNKSLPDLIFHPVKDDKIHTDLCNLIRSDDTRIREARDEDMDRILELFYGDQAENLMEIAEFMKREQSITLNGDGKFRSYRHAPSAYAFKQYFLNYTAKELDVTLEMWNRTGLTDINREQTRAKTLLETSWFSHAREHFSWKPLADFINPSTIDARGFMRTGHELAAVNQRAALAIKIEEALHTKHPDLAEVKALLKQIQASYTVNENYLVQLVLSIGGVVASPVALLMGLVWAIPALIVGSPYFGKPAFFIDTFQWFAESLVNTLQLIIVPLGMVNAYNRSGSMDINQSEFNRIAETLLSRMSDAPMLTEHATHEEASERAQIANGI